VDTRRGFSCQSPFLSSGGINRPGCVFAKGCPAGAGAL